MSIHFIIACFMLVLGISCAAYVIWCFATYREHRVSCLWAMLQTTPALVAAAIFFEATAK